MENKQVIEMPGEAPPVVVDRKKECGSCPEPYGEDCIGCDKMRE